MAQTAVIFETTEVVYEASSQTNVTLPANAQPIIYLADDDSIQISLPGPSQPQVFLESVGIRGAQGQAAATGISFFVGGHLRDGETLYYAPVIGNMPISSTNSRISARVAPSVNVVFTLMVDNGDFVTASTFGIATMAAGETECTFSSFAAPALLDGQNFSVIAPISANASLEDVGFNFVS